MVEIGMWLLGITVFLVVGAIVVGCLRSGQRTSQNSQDTQTEDDDYEEYEEIDDILQKQNFKVTKQYFLTEYLTYNSPDWDKKTIKVDDENKKVAFVDYKQNEVIIVDYNEIVNYEVYENEKQHNTNVHVGFGVLLGGTDTNCKQLRLIIRVNNIDRPQIVYELMEGTLFGVGLVKTSKQYMAIIESLQEVTSFLEVVMNENKKKENKIQPQLVAEQRSLKEQLVEIKELYYAGLITEEEYNKKRKELLK